MAWKLLCYGQRFSPSIGGPSPSIADPCGINGSAWETTMRMLKKFLMASTAVMATVAVAGAANAAALAACPTTTLSNYLSSGFACTIGDKTFSNFTYGTNTTTPGTVNPATSVSVMLTLGPPNLGFTFGTILASGVNGAADALITYDVAVTNAATDQ
jgi:hypothetical protein